MRKRASTLILAAVLVSLFVLAWAVSDRDGRNESQREPLGTPLTVDLQFAKTPVTIAATEIRPITAAEFTDGGFERWETFYSVDLTDKQVWAVSFTVVRAGEGEIDPFAIGSSSWEVVTASGERIASSWPWGATLPCAPADEWRDPGVTSCAFFIVPESETVAEVQFTGVDRSSSSPRQIGPIERYVTWTTEPS